MVEEISNCIYRNLIMYLELLLNKIMFKNASIKYSLSSGNKTLVITIKIIN